MRYLALLLLLSSCQSWGWSDTADALLPDEFTLGEGSSSINTIGGYQGHHHMYEYDGEGESTYAALTWHLPSVKTDNGMTRETQRNLALLVDHMASEQGLTAAAEEPEGVEPTVSSAPLQLNLRDGVSLPSKEILFGVLGALLIAFMFFRYQKSQSSRRRW